MNEMIKACLFDLDGVVFDTEPLYTEFWRNIFKEFYLRNKVGIKDKGADAQPDLWTLFC